MMEANWENLKKEAINLENEVDQKLVSYSKYLFNLKDKEEAKYEFDEEDPRMDKPSSFNSMAVEIEALLREVRALTKKKKNLK